MGTADDVCETIHGHHESFRMSGYFTGLNAVELEKVRGGSLLPEASHAAAAERYKEVKEASSGLGEQS